jgi:hypothetical protein
LKLLPLSIEEGLHVVTVKIWRRPVIAGVFGKEYRHGRPSGDADQMGVKSLGEAGGYADAAPQLGVHIDVHHQGRVGHRSSLQ